MGETNRKKADEALLREGVISETVNKAMETPPIQARWGGAPLYMEETSTTATPSPRASFKPHGSMVRSPFLSHTRTHDVASIL